MIKSARNTLSSRQISAIKVIVFFLCLVPAVQLAYGLVDHTLGPNPIEAITLATGAWTLRMLLITLAVTPLRRLTKLHWLVRLRRMLGLFAFGWATAHFIIWLWLDRFFDWREIAYDILDRPFITVGFSAFLLLIPLAATSSNAAVRRLGGRRWLALHQLVYLIATLGVVHFWWQVKADTLEPAIYAAILAVLLGIRFIWHHRDRRKQRVILAGKQRFRGIPIVLK